VKNSPVAIKADLTDEQQARRWKSLKRVWHRSRARPVDALSEAECGKPQGAMEHCDYAGIPDRQPNVPMRDAPEKERSIAHKATIAPAGSLSQLR